MKRFGLWLGPVMAVAILVFTDISPDNPKVTAMAAVALLMAVWWITEALPLAVTALLPVALFPLLGIMDGQETAAQYFNHVIFLFMGGFMVALAMQRWNLHKRIALFILLRFSHKPAFILLGFMASTAFLSMWISNTATAMMMVPIALSVVIDMEKRTGSGQMSQRFGVGMLLGIAYSASIGGIATLVGTPPNLSFARIYAISFPEAPPPGFADWFFFAFPVAVILLFITWGLLSLMWLRGAMPTNKTLVRDEYRALGPMGPEERSVLIIFSLLALMWLSRADIDLGIVVLPGWDRLFAQPGLLNDGVVAIFFGITLFLLPAQNGGRIMEWKTAEGIPWGIILLFGGGFALAKGFMESGLSTWIGQELGGLGNIPSWSLVASISGSITFLTELTSNTATAEMILPILAALSTSIGVHPMLLMVPATLSSSFAFMMPVATPPNAIIFGTDRIRVIDMVKTGLWLNLIGIVVVTLAIFLLGGVLY